MPAIEDSHLHEAVQEAIARLRCDQDQLSVDLWKFVERECLERAADGSFEPRIARVRLRRKAVVAPPDGSEADGYGLREVVTEVAVPLLTLLPLPLLQITRAQVVANGAGEPSVEVVLERAEAPAGLRTLIEALTASIQPIQVDEG